MKKMKTKSRKITSKCYSIGRVKVSSTQAALYLRNDGRPEIYNTCDHTRKVTSLTVIRYIRVITVRLRHCNTSEPTATRASQQLA